MNNENEQLSIFNKNQIQETKTTEAFGLEKALMEFEELKQIALNCYDKNGNPNIQAAIRALENKAKIAGLYGNIKKDNNIFVKMNDITLDGKQLKLNIGEDLVDD